jgi:hypothetical protein
MTNSRRPRSIPRSRKLLAEVRQEVREATAALAALEQAATDRVGDDELVRRALHVCSAVGHGFLRTARARAIVDRPPPIGDAPEVHARRRWATWRPFAIVELQLHDLVAATWRALASAAVAGESAEPDDSPPGGDR